VSSYFIAGPVGVVIDPKIPEDGGWEALPAAPEQVLLISGHHLRDAQECAARFGIPIRCSSEAAEDIGDEVWIETFANGDPLPHHGKTALREFVESSAGRAEFGPGL
jgi:hypothetical protein